MRNEARLTEVLVKADQLARRVRELAGQINTDYAGRELLLIGVLKGALVFLSDLMRRIDVPCEIDFITVTSYGLARESSGLVKVERPVETELEGRHVLVVEDIVETGRTMQRVLRELGAHNPASLEVCVLLMKQQTLKVALEPPRYVGFDEIPNRFVVGYGLDYAQHYRNLPNVTMLDEVRRSTDSA